MPGSVKIQLLIAISALLAPAVASFDGSCASSGSVLEAEASDESCAQGQDVVLLQTNLAILQSHAPKSSEHSAEPAANSLSVVGGDMTAGGHQDVNASATAASLVSVGAKDVNASATVASLVSVGAKMLLNAMINPDEVNHPDIDLEYGAITVAGLTIVTLVFWVLGYMMVGCAPAEWQAACTQWLSISMCFLLLSLSFCSYGVLQEFIMTMDYANPSDSSLFERFPSAAFLILVNRIFVVTVASALLVFRGESLVMPASKYASIPAATIFLSSWCQHGSLRFISFPTQMVFKSCKIVPTMGVNTLLNNQRHTVIDYGYAVVITACVIGFVAASATYGSDANGRPVIGVVMMLTFLLCDSFTSNAEKRIYNSWRDFDNVQMMLAVGFFSLIYSVLGLMATFSFGEMHAFIERHPECITQIVLLAISSVCGQYLIFYIIRAHGPVAFSVMMTIRQMFSLAISAVLFSHPLGMVQTTCAAVCFAVLLLRPLLKLCSKPEAGDGQQDKKFVGSPPR